MQATIAGVKHKAREWNGPNGTVCFVEGEFDDGSHWSLGCKPENVQARIDELSALVGKPGQFECEQKPEYNGVAQWKMKTWPGKPQGGGGFGGGNGPRREYVPAYSQSQDAFDRTQKNIHRSVALEHAVKLAIARGKDDNGTILRYATEFYDWLSKPMTLSDPKPHQSEAGATETPPAAATSYQNEPGAYVPLPTNAKVTQHYVVWESAAKTLQAKNEDLWPTFQDLLHDLKPQLQNMGLGTPRLLKECESPDKFATLLKAIQNKIKDSVPF